MNSNQKSLCLQLKSSLIEISSNSDELLRLLEKDCSHFVVAKGSTDPKYKHSLDLQETSNVPLKVPFYSLPFQRGRFWGWGKYRWVQYNNGSTLELQVESSRKKTLRLQASDLLDLKNLSFLIIQGLWGEDLEREGFLRVHALCYSTVSGGGIMSADSGLGKSTIASRLLDQKDTEVFSDEIAWIHDNFLHPYLIPLAKKNENSKILLPLPLVPKDTLAHLKEVICVFKDEEIFSNCRLYLHTKLLIKIVKGHHLPQMVEIFLRRDNVLHLARLFFIRIAKGICLLRRFKVKYLIVDNHVTIDELNRKSELLSLEQKKPL